MGTVWHAREATLKLAASITIDATGPLDADFGAGTEFTILDVTITEPKGEVDGAYLVFSKHIL